MSVPKAYENIARLQILCAVQSDRGVEHSVEKDLCEAIRAEALRGAPIEVEAIAPGSPKVLAADALTLIVHAGLEGDSLAVSIRPFRPSGGEADVLFGARPFIVPADAPERLRPAVRSALDELLPWRARSTEPRRID